MVDSVGKKLSSARLKQGLTIEEVAHATKLRPDKILALENDDYSSFPSNVYAKGFLQIYGRYLHVDVSQILQSLESSNAISIEDYQYLSNAPAPKQSEPVRRERRPPSIAPLIFFVFVVVAAICTMWVITTYKRTLPSGAPEKEESAGPSPSGEPASTNASASTNPATTPASASAATATPAPAPAPIKPAVSANAKGFPTPAPAPATTSTPVPKSKTPAAPTSPGVVAEGPAASAPPSPTSPTSPIAVPTPRISASAQSDRDFITPVPVTTPDPAAETSPRSGLNEVLVASVKKTWVAIRKDDPKAAPIFEDFLYPNENPLKLKGARFFIDARDPTAVQITKNGLPFAYQAPNIPVQ